MLFSEQRNASLQPEYQDYFIAAAKNSKLITATFSTLCDIIATGDLPFHRLREAKEMNTEMNSTRVQAVTLNILNSLLGIMSPAFYSAAIIDIDVSMFIRPDCRNRIAYLIKRPDWEYHQECGIPKHIIHLSDSIDRPRIEDEMEQELIN